MTPIQRALGAIGQRDPQLMAMRRACVGFLALMISFALASGLRALAGLNVDVVVIAVVLAIVLNRSATVRSAKAVVIGLIELVLITLVAGQTGRLVLEHSVIGSAVFTAAMTLAVWLKRFPGAVSELSPLITAPFLVVLVTPVPTPPGTGFALWATFIAGAVYLVIGACQRLAALTKFVPPVERHTRTKLERPRARFDGRTRMALHMAVALSISSAVGHAIFGRHWPWVVLSTYIVCNGNRGHIDVIYKGTTRLLGAVVGTLLATLIASRVQPGNQVAIVLIFLLLALALWLRHFNYAYWAMAVTASLALLYDYYGQSGIELLDERLGGVLIGCTIAALVCWFVFPVRTQNIARLRLAEALASVSSYLAALSDAREEIYEPVLKAMRSQTSELKETIKPLRAMTRFNGSLESRRALQALVGIQSVIVLLADSQHASGHEGLGENRAELVGLMRSDVASLRVALRDRTIPAFRPAPEHIPGESTNDSLQEAQRLLRLIEP